jgi:hypothetical protein
MVTAFLVYCSVGSLIWLVLDGLGIIENTFAARNSSTGAMVLATLFMIVGWPLFVWKWAKGMAS